MSYFWTFLFNSVNDSLEFCYLLFIMDIEFHCFLKIWKETYDQRKKRNKKQRV